MSIIESSHKNILSHVVLVLSLGASVSHDASAAALVEEEGFCSNVTPVALGTSLRAQAYDAVRPDCYQVELPGAGLAVFEVVMPATADAEPRLSLLGSICDTSSAPEVQVIDRLAGRVLLFSAEARRVELCVGSQDPAQRLDEYRLYTRFARHTTTDFSEEEQQLELEPEGFRIHALPRLDFSEEEQQLELEPEGVRTFGLAALCHGTESDDHGDTTLCATSLTMGHTIQGELANAWGDDTDVFAFALAAQRTVRIRAAGKGELLANLYDARGQRLAASTRSAPRLVKTLEPGLYFVRVEGRDHAEGSYELSFDTVEHSW